MPKIPTMMKAMVLVGHGGLDQLVWREDVPTPAPALGEVLIRVRACGLNNTDINTRTAWYSKNVTQGITEKGGAEGFASAGDDSASWSSAPVTFPRIQGADATGEIVAVGDGVDPGRIGARVLVDPWILPRGDWRDSRRAVYFGSECDGGFAEYTRIPSENALTISTALSDAELATFSCAVTTAENLVAKTALQPGETVVIAGASGGVGSFAVQLARLRGARVLAVAAPPKAAALRQLGAQHVIDRNSEDLEAAIRAHAPEGIDVALDVVGGGMTMPLLAALKSYGRYSSCGAIAGPMIRFDLRQLIYKDVHMTGATIVPPGTMARLVPLIENGSLKPNLAASFPLRDLHKAQETFMAKTHTGNIVVEME